MPLPATVQSLIGQTARLQRQFNQSISEAVAGVRQGTSLRPAVLLVWFALLYGVFHAVGPGHGKVVAVTYFLSRRAQLLHGLRLSSFIAGVQALVAIVLVAGLALLLGISAGDVLAQAYRLEVVSYGLMVLIGGYLALTAWRPHEHAHGPPQGFGPGTSTRELLATAGAVGLRPCSGAILVLLFTTANGLFLLGAVATLAMGVGVALTNTFIGTSAIGVQRGLALLTPANPIWGRRLRAGVALGGGVLILLLGCTLLLGALQRGAW